MKRKNLKIKAIEKGISQKELAKKVGVSSQAITDYIRGTYNPRFEVMKKISEELETPVTELFFS